MARRAFGDAIVGAAVLISLMAGCLSAPEPPPDGSAWAFTDTRGVTHTERSIQGAPSVLFFMATWCSSCAANAPRLANVHAEFAEAGLQAFSLTWDPLETERDLEAWMERHNQSWPHGVDPGNRIARHYGVTSQSTVIFLDADGDVVERFGFRAQGIPEAQLRDAAAASIAASQPHEEEGADGHGEGATYA